MKSLFIDLDDNEVMDKVSELASEYEVEFDGEYNYYCAFVDGGWLPNTYDTEGQAYRAILAELIGEEKTCFE